MPGRTTPASRGILVIRRAYRPRPTAFRRSPARAYSVTVTVTRLSFSQQYGLPRGIVWDAFTDQVLIGGWLGEASVEPVEGGRYRLEWVVSPDLPPAEGRILRLVEPSLILIETDVHGLLRVELQDIPGGPRGRSTRVDLSVTVDVSAPFRRRVADTWSLGLIQLEELLRGHPVDWSEASPRRTTLSGFGTGAGAGAGAGSGAGADLG